MALSEAKSPPEAEVRETPDGEGRTQGGAGVTTRCDGLAKRRAGLDLKECSGNEEDGGKAVLLSALPSSANAG